ncbi:MAG: glycosyltransferase [Candidatus Aminicenantes bacterium]
MKDPLLSVIIPVHNGSQTLGRCLEGLFRSSYARFECIVVDDHSTDSTVRVAESFDTKVIRMERKQGAAHARNRGAEASRGDILLFVDADVEVYPDSMEKVVKAFERNPHISAFFGSYDDHPGSQNFFSQYKNLFHHYIHQTSREEASTFWSAFGAVKREAFFEVGRFNEQTRMMEDIELGYKLRARGRRIRLHKSIGVKHLKHFSFSHLLKSDLLDRAVPWTVLMWKYRQFTDDLNLKLRHRLSAVIPVLLVVSILMGILRGWFLWGVPALLFLYFLFNGDVYAFFLRKRGFLFALKVVPLHILYYLYSLLGFVIGTFRYFLRIEPSPMR